MFSFLPIKKKKKKNVMFQQTNLKTPKVLTLTFM